ncbi:MAG: hypothetical protein ABJL92_10640 [Sulfitobacter sp.]|uniref:hypothetical protein n=1 Tax=Sulfitobacter sp. TaxID=1903071 RepID=UPI0032985537
MRWCAAALLTFHRKPSGEDDTKAYTYLKDASLLLRDGKIAGRGAWDSVRLQAADAPVTDHRPYLMMAGFIDTHIHFPQAQVWLFLTSAQRLRRRCVWNGQRHFPKSCFCCR